MDSRSSHSVGDEDRSSQSGPDYTPTSSDIRDEALPRDTTGQPRITIENGLESLSLQPWSPGREILPPVADAASGRDALVRAQVDIPDRSSSGVSSESWQEGSSTSHHRPLQVPISQRTRARSTDAIRGGPRSASNGPADGGRNPQEDARRSYSRSQSTSATPESVPTELDGSESLIPADSYDESPIPTNESLVDGLDDLSLDEVESPYDPRVETPPEEPFYDNSFQEAIELAKTLAGDISRSVSGYQLVHNNESEISRIRSIAQRLEKFRPPETRIIGIVGESGSGITFCRKINPIADVVYRKE